MIWVLIVLLAAMIPTAGWLGFTYGYRRGSEDTIEANDFAREGFLDTMSEASRW